jgi:acetyl/propionyl-CoA carboxylase alpha subunit
MELRVYAEDSMNDFYQAGHLVYQLPVGDGIRVDNGFEQGMDIRSIMIQCFQVDNVWRDERRGYPDYA